MGAFNEDEDASWGNTLSNAGSAYIFEKFVFPPHTTTFTATEIGAKSVKLNFDAMKVKDTTDGYIIILRENNTLNTTGFTNGSAFNPNNLTDGNTYIITITRKTQTDYVIDHLEPSTQYYAFIIPYDRPTNDASNKYNLIDIPSVSFTTLAYNSDNFKKFSYQGVLEDANGDKVADGEYPMTFKLYLTAENGNPVWTENQQVTVTNGVFNVTLGSITPINYGFDTSFYLGVKVGADPEMTPRTAIVGSSYRNGGLGR